MFTSMTYPEKSAWVSLIFLIIAGAQWFGVTAVGVLNGNAFAVPDGNIVFTATMTVAVFIVVHILLAVTDLKSAASRGDERDRVAAYKAGYRTSFVLQFGSGIGVLAFVANRDGDVLFHIIIATIFIALVIDSVLRLLSYRNMA